MDESDLDLVCHPLLCCFCHLNDRQQNKRLYKLFPNTKPPSSITFTHYLAAFVYQFPELSLAYFSLRDSNASEFVHVPFLDGYEDLDKTDLE